MNGGSPFIPAGITLTGFIHHVETSKLERVTWGGRVLGTADTPRASAFQARFLAGSKKGFFTTTAGALLVCPSTVISMSSPVPGWE